MFDFDAGKLLIIGVIALVVIGPKDLPRVLRQVGQAVGRLRRMAGEFQGQFMDAMKEADLQDIRNEMTKLGSDTQLNMHFDPVRDVQTELTQALAPQSTMSSAVQAIEAGSTNSMDGFRLPDIAPDGETITMAATGLAPVVETAEPTEPAQAAVLAGPRKRKIVLARRRPLFSKPHKVSDRTAPARSRPFRARRQEATER